VQGYVCFINSVLVKKKNGLTCQEHGSEVLVTFVEDGLHAEVFVRMRYAAERHCAEHIISHVSIQLPVTCHSMSQACGAGLHNTDHH
jgi:hypothetical protein